MNFCRYSTRKQNRKVHSGEKSSLVPLSSCSKFQHQIILNYFLTLAFVKMTIPHISLNSSHSLFENDFLPQTYFVQSVVKN